MQAKFNQQVVSFATQQWGGNNTNNQSSSSKSDSRSCRSKKEPYTVAAWRLVKTKDKVTMNGKKISLVHQRSSFWRPEVQWNVRGSQTRRSWFLVQIDWWQMCYLQLRQKSKQQCCSCSCSFCCTCRCSETHVEWQALQCILHPRWTVRGSCGLHLGGCSGKRVGPNYGWSSTRILALFCFLLSLPIWLTLILPTILILITKLAFATIDSFGCIIRYLEQYLPFEILMWLGYTMIPHIIAILHGFIAFIQGLFSVPLYFWTLLWHPNGRSILDMLWNPEGHGCHIQRTNDPRQWRFQERAQPLPCWVWRRKPCRLRFHWSTIVSNDNPIQGYDSRLCMFSYYQIHPTSINKTDGSSSSKDGVTANVRSKINSWQPQFASSLLSGIKIIQKAWPKQPPCGLISSFLVLLTTIGIIMTLSGMKCLEIKALSTASEGATSITPCSKGDNTDSESASWFSDDYHEDIKYLLGFLNGFTSSFADGDLEQLNVQVHFDTNSVFFVCDNSTTGHICNNICKFIPGLLHQTNKSLTTAIGTGPCLQEGTVRIHLNNNDGQKHIFILNSCLYHPDSLVNLLSTKQLAEKFIDSHGNPNKQTRIESRYSTHVLTWSFRNYKKTFPTPLSGLPELLLARVIMHSNPSAWKFLHIPLRH